MSARDPPNLRHWVGWGIKKAGKQGRCLCAVILIMNVAARECCLVVRLSGNIVGLINEVTVHRAGLVLRWVTIRGYTVSVFNQATQANSI